MADLPKIQRLFSVMNVMNQDKREKLFAVDYLNTQKLLTGQTRLDVQHSIEKYVQRLQHYNLTPSSGSYVLPSMNMPEFLKGSGIFDFNYQNGQYTFTDEQINALKDFINKNAIGFEFDEMSVPFVYYDRKNKRFDLNTGAVLGEDEAMQYNRFTNAMYDIRGDFIGFYGREQQNGSQYKLYRIQSPDDLDQLKNMQFSEIVPVFNINMHNIKDNVSYSFNAAFGNENFIRRLYRNISEQLIKGSHSYYQQEERTIGSMIGKQQGYINSGDDIYTSFKSDDTLARVMQSAPIEVDKNGHAKSLVILKNQITDTMEHQNVNVYSLEKDHKNFKSVAKRIVSGETENIRLVARDLNSAKVRENINKLQYAIRAEMQKMSDELGLTQDDLNIENIKAKIRSSITVIDENAYREQEDFIRRLYAQPQMFESMRQFGIRTSELFQNNFFKTFDQQQIQNIADYIKNAGPEDLIKKYITGQVFGALLEYDEVIHSNLKSFNNELNKIIPDASIRRDITLKVNKMFELYKQSVSTKDIVEYKKIIDTLASEYKELQDIVKQHPVLQTIDGLLPDLPDISKNPWLQQFDISLFAGVNKGNKLNYIEGLVDLNTEYMFSGISPDQLRRIITQRLAQNLFTDDELKNIDLTQQDIIAELRKPGTLDTTKIAFLEGFVNNLDEITLNNFANELSRKGNDILTKEMFEAGVGKNGKPVYLHANELVTAIFQIIESKKQGQDISLRNLFYGYKNKKNSLYDLIANKSLRKDYYITTTQSQNAIQNLLRIQQATVQDQQELEPHLEVLLPSIIDSKLSGQLISKQVAKHMIQDTISSGDKIDVEKLKYLNFLQQGGKTGGYNDGSQFGNLYIPNLYEEINQTANNINIHDIFKTSSYKYDKQKRNVKKSFYGKRFAGFNIIEKKIDNINKNKYIYTKQGDFANRKIAEHVNQFYTSLFKSGIDQTDKQKIASSLQFGYMYNVKDLMSKFGINSQSNLEKFTRNAIFRFSFEKNVRLFNLPDNFSDEDLQKLKKEYYEILEDYYAQFKQKGITSVRDIKKFNRPFAQRLQKLIRTNNPSQNAEDIQDLILRQVSLGEMFDKHTIVSHLGDIRKLLIKDLISNQHDKDIYTLDTVLDYLNKYSVDELSKLQSTDQIAKTAYNGIYILNELFQNYITGESNFDIQKELYSLFVKTQYSPVILKEIYSRMRTDGYLGMGLDKYFDELLYKLSDQQDAVAQLFQQFRNIFNSDQSTFNVIKQFIGYDIKGKSGSLPYILGKYIYDLQIMLSQDPNNPDLSEGIKQFAIKSIFSDDINEGLTFIGQLLSDLTDAQYKSMLNEDQINKTLSFFLYGNFDYKNQKEAIDKPLQRMIYNQLDEYFKQFNIDITGKDFNEILFNQPILLKQQIQQELMDMFNLKKPIPTEMFDANGNLTPEFQDFLDYIETQQVGKYNLKTQLSGEVKTSKGSKKKKYEYFTSTSQDSKNVELWSANYINTLLARAKGIDGNRLTYLTYQQLKPHLRANGINIAGDISIKLVSQRKTGGTGTIEKLQATYHGQIKTANKFALRINPKLANSIIDEIVNSNLFEISGNLITIKSEFVELLEPFYKAVNNPGDINNLLEFQKQQKKGNILNDQIKLQQISQYFSKTKHIGHNTLPNIHDVQITKILQGVQTILEQTNGDEQAVQAFMQKSLNMDINKFFETVFGINLKQNFNKTVGELLKELMQPGANSDVIIGRGLIQYITAALNQNAGTITSETKPLTIDDLDIDKLKNTVVNVLDPNTTLFNTMIFFSDNQNLQLKGILGVNRGILGRQDKLSLINDMMNEFQVNFKNQQNRAFTLGVNKGAKVLSSKMKTLDSILAEAIQLLPEESINKIANNNIYTQVKKTFDAFGINADDDTMKQFNQFLLLAELSSGKNGERTLEVINTLIIDQLSGQDDQLTKLSSELEMVSNESVERFLRVTRNVEMVMGKDYVAEQINKSTGSIDDFQAMLQKFEQISRSAGYPSDNYDLGQEFSNIITIQRGYSESAKQSTNQQEILLERFEQGKIQTVEDLQRNIEDILQDSNLSNTVLKNVIDYIQFNQDFDLDKVKNIYENFVEVANDDGTTEFITGAREQDIHETTLIAMLNNEREEMLDQTSVSEQQIINEQVAQKQIIDATTGYIKQPDATVSGAVQEEVNEMINGRVSQTTVVDSIDSGVRNQAPKVNEEFIEKITNQAEGFFGDVKNFISSHKKGVLITSGIVGQLATIGMFERQKHKDDIEDLKKVISYNEYKELPPVIPMSNSPTNLGYYYQQHMYNSYQNRININQL